MAGLVSARLILQRSCLLKCRNSIGIANRSYSNDVIDKKTHTGQSWEKDDYRLVRFVDRPKHVNTQFAIDLINAVPPQPRKDRVVWCDGGGGPTGHPKVYINLDKPGNHICGYCGLRFVKDGKH